MNRKMKLCVKCKYYYDHLCSNTLLGYKVTYDPVTGDENREYELCRKLRDDKKLCGIEATYWEPKETWLTSWFK